MEHDHIVLIADPADAEDRGVSAESLERGLRARFIRRVRTELGLTQTEFAHRFRVPVALLRDWEHARVTAPDFAVAYFRVISLHSDLVAQAVR